MPEAAAESQPVQDEWGLYDPSRCGIQALMAKLDASDAQNAAEGRRPKSSAMQKVIGVRTDGARTERRPAAGMKERDIGLPV